MSLMGILGNVALAAFKLTAGIIGKSGAMVSDAAHSLSDVVATLIAYIGVRLSRQEEDANHPYGHERADFESHPGRHRYRCRLFGDSKVVSCA